LKITGCKTNVVLNPKFKQNKTTKSRSKVKAVLIYILAKLHYMLYRVIHLVTMLSLSQTHDHQLAINYLIFKWHPEILRLTNVIDQFISETVKKNNIKQ
jgi:hypothetical protein